MAYGMVDMIRKVTNMFNMTLIEEQIQKAMLEGKWSITFEIDDKHTPGVNLPTGKIHSMQAVKLAHDGFTVERSMCSVTVSGWANLKPFEIPE